ncbi:MAG: hypothetical protein J5495_01275 [Bacteroidales bacterium]|nr:hypothetical protein [Bacteroidales bacterium]
MKKIISLFAMAALVSAAVGSCTVEPPRDSYSEDGYIVFTASQESVDGTRTEVSGTKVLWSPGDSISVFYKTSNWQGGTKFINTATSPSATADFSGVLNNLAGGTPDGTSWFAALYPYNTDNGFSPTYSGTNPGVSINIPNEQTAVPGSFDPNAFFSVAVSKDTRLQFYNICGGIALTFGEGCQNYTSVTIKSNMGDKLAADTGVYLDNPSEPKPSEFSWAYGSISLKAPEGGFQPGVEYLVSTLPTVLREGFSMLFRRNDGKIAVKRFSKPQTIYRSTFGRISGFDTDLVWVEEKQEDVTSLLTGQWLGSDGSYYLDINSSYPGYFTRVPTDDPDLLLTDIYPLRGVVRNVYGETIIIGETRYNEVVPFYTFPPFTGSSARFYENFSDDTVYGDDIYEVNAATSHFSNQIVEICFVIDGSRYRFLVYQKESHRKLKEIADNNGGKLPIVYIDGPGVPEDFNGVDVSGKVAIVNYFRNGYQVLSFVDKAKNAAAAGAVGVLFLNNHFNPDNDTYPYMTGAPIPGGMLDMRIKPALLSGRTYFECVTAVPSDMY